MMTNYTKQVFMLPTLLLLLFLISCSSASPTPTSVPPTADGETEAVLEMGETAVSLTPIPAIPDTLATQLMYDLSSENADVVEATLQTILDKEDGRFVSVLLELMRARQLGIISSDYTAYVNALEMLSGQSFGDDWPAWITWYGQTDLTPPPGFVGWKGSILQRIDEGFAGFLQDQYPNRIRAEEILWGGVRIDGIPPLENAPMIPADEAGYLRDDEPVFGIVVNGDARAYPLRIIDNHEMANDIIGGVPVSIAYCTLCGAAIAYDGRMPNGQETTFGTSGFLYRSNKLMYDRLTRTLWNQLTGEPVLGELADSDMRLTILPIVLANWGDWLEQHPDTLVLDRDTGIYEAEFYESGILYGDYFASEETMFPVWQRSTLLPDKDFVYTLYLDGLPKAYHVNTVAKKQVVNDAVGETKVVLVAMHGTTAVSGNNRSVGEVNYTNGGEVRAFDRGEHRFSAGADDQTVVDEDGRLWQISEDGLISPDGEIAPRIAGHLAYWFGWYAFFPNTLLYGPE